MCFEIETVDGHLTFPGASVDAPGSYGEAESLGFFFAGREKVLFSDKGAEGGDAGSPPVGDTAGECDIGAFGGADRFAERDKAFDHIAVGSHTHLVAAVTDGDRGGSGFFCLGEEEGGVGDHVVEDFTAQLLEEIKNKAM